MPQETLLFTPIYTVVGVYRLLTDPQLRVPIWKKLKHGLVRGAIVGAIWSIATFSIQRAFVRVFLINTPRVTGLSNDTVFGYKIPVATYATLLFLSSQVQFILQFFVGKNLRIARDRAWNQTLESRGKGEDFWQPYVEEWQKPPHVGFKTERPVWEKWVANPFGRMVIKKVILLPLNFYPGVGILISAALKAIGTARFLHKPYFEQKKMTPQEIVTFMAERKADYHAFGFAAALFESFPLIGMFFTISNRIGACMWAFDLEKRQHAFREGLLNPLPPRIVEVPVPELNNPGQGVTKVEISPRASSGFTDGASSPEKMAGAW